MTEYFSTFVSGLGEVVVDALRSKIPDVEVTEILDGLVVYRTSAKFQEIRQLRFFNNSFALLESVKGTSSDNALKSLVDKVLRSNISVSLEKRTSFRIMFSKENQPVAIEPQTLEALERKLVSKNLSVNRTSPGIELLFLVRRDGYGYFGLRLTRHPDYKKILHSGELRPELADLLCFLSEPKTTDIFLDPFSGYGAIPIERATTFPYGKIYVGEIDPALVDGLKQKTGRFGKKFIVGKLDATNLAEFQDASVDKIVTDPPWGIYQNGENLGELYSSTFKEVERVLKPGGILVLLTANKGLMDLCLPKFPKLKLKKTYDILVSGKKAAVYKIIRESD